MSLPPIYSYLSLETALALIQPMHMEKTAAAGAAVRTVIKGLAGFGVGTAAGYGTAALANKVFHAATGEELPNHLLLPAASLLGAGMGLAYSMYKTKELEELQRALKAKRNDAAKRIPSK
jgi:hypothetical protein